MFPLLCGAERNNPFLENVFVLVFIFVWKLQKTKLDLKGGVALENFRPEVLVSLESFLKIFRKLTLDSVSGKLYAIILLYCK